MFQQKKRKKICGSGRKYEEEVSSEAEEDVSSNDMAQQDVSEQWSDLWRCSEAMFQHKKRKKICGSGRKEEEEESSEALKDMSSNVMTL